MGQRNRILAEILGVRGWNVTHAYFEDASGKVVLPLAGYDMVPSARLVLQVKRKWAPRCCQCGAICGRSAHEKRPVRRWLDLAWGPHTVVVEAAPLRVACKRCGSCRVELLPWAEPHQRQTTRLQQRLALEAASMPVMHVAVMHALSWGTVRRAEAAALSRWAASRESSPLRMAGLDEKWLGRRGSRPEKFVTIASDLETGEPLWIGYGRSEATVSRWLTTMSKEEKAAIKLFATDMHRPFANAILADGDLAHAVRVHDPFHVMKRAGEAITELRREVFFRASPEMRQLGRGTRWLVLRPWERCNDDQRMKLHKVFSLNGKLARAYQLVEELREALRAPDRASIQAGLMRILRRTERRDNKPMRKWHDSLEAHWNPIVALGDHRPPTGRVEALNNNWETLVRRARGYRDLDYLLLKLRFMTINPIHTKWDIERFLALGVQPPLRRVA